MWSGQKVVPLNLQFSDFLSTSLPSIMSPPPLCPPLLPADTGSLPTSVFSSHTSTGGEGLCDSAAGLPFSHEPNRLYRFQFSNTLVTTPTNYLTCRMIVDVLRCVLMWKSFLFRKISPILCLFCSK